MTTRMLLFGFFCLALGLAARAPQARGQDAGAGAGSGDYALHVAVVELESFIAVGGAKQGAAGLYRHRQDTTWTHMGWANTRNFGLDVVEADPETIYLACGNGVLRTLDGGATWRVTTDWRMTEVLDVAVDPSRPTDVYAATAYGVWRSTDRGASWSEVNDGIKAPESTFTPAIAADRRAAGRLVVGSEQGLYRTTNGGLDWTPVGPRDIAIRDVVQSRAAPDLWLAGTEESGVWRSRDGGATWEQVGGDVAVGTIYAVAADPSDPDRLAAAGFEGGVYVSGDGGEQWERAGLTDVHIHALAYDPRASGQLWAGTIGDGVYRRPAEAAGDDAWAYAGMGGAEVWNMAFFPVPDSRAEAQ
jgi:hypothetical protein